MRPLLAAASLCSLVPISTASVWLAEEHIGPKVDAHAQQEWPDGLLPLVRHPARVYSLWVNGNENFNFQATAAQIPELLTRYSKCHLRDHRVRLVDGAPIAKSFKGQMIPYNVDLHVLGGIALAFTRRERPATETFEPTLTIYAADEDVQQALRKWSWPVHLIVVNEVPGLELNVGRKQPARRLLHTQIEFEDGKPAADFENGMTTTITLWRKQDSTGFNLGKVEYDGKFRVALSLQEISQLRKGEMWLTMTVGNFITKPKPGDARLNVDSLKFDADAIKPVQVARSAFYHGRILFEDGSPPALDPAPWPGAFIQVSFPYAGMVRPDAKGYFKVTLTESQLADVKQKKQRRNIYVPSWKRRNSSTALHVFPADRLTRDVTSIRPVRIPRPEQPATEPAGASDSD